MSYLFIQAYKHIQRRSVRLGLLCAFVITFMGLPAFGQYAGTNVFASMDLIEILGDRIDEAAVSMQEARYQAYLADTHQLDYMEEDPLIMLAEELDEEAILWDIETMFKNVFEGPAKH